MTIQETLRAVRAEIGPVYDFNENGDRVDHLPYPTREQLGWLLNKVAWLHRNEGWGLSVKRSGYNVPAPDGEPVASDILHNKFTNVIVDVLVAAGERSDPTWQELGPQTDSSRPWKAPIPVEVPEPDPNPDPQPDPNTPLDALFAAVVELQGQVAAMHRDLLKLSAAFASFGAPVEFKIFGSTIKGWVGKKP